MTENQWTILMNDINRFEKSFAWIKDAKIEKRIKKNIKK